jgi:hypothetical protein
MLIKAILNSIVILSICLPMYVFGQTTFTDVTDQAGVGDTNYSVGIAWGDFNNDGWQDLYVVNLGQGNILYVNNGDGTFDDVTAIAGVGDTGPGVGCAWGDYDNDDLIDLFVSNRPGSSRLYRNQGDTIFIDMATIYSMSYPSGMGESVVWGDYDKDGYIDLYKVRMNQPNILYHNLRGEGFEDVTAFAGVGDAGPGEGATWCDYDDDGFIDLYVINAGGCNLLCHNNGNGTFTDLASYAGIRQPGSSFGCAWGDLTMMAISICMWEGMGLASFIAIMVMVLLKMSALRQVLILTAGHWELLGRIMTTTGGGISTWPTTKGMMSCIGIWAMVYLMMSPIRLGFTTIIIAEAIPGEIIITMVF